MSTVQPNIIYTLAEIRVLLGLTLVQTRALRQALDGKAVDSDRYRGVDVLRVLERVMRRAA